jgi:hypothetical protein
MNLCEVLWNSKRSGKLSDLVLGRVDTERLEHISIQAWLHITLSSLFFYEGSASSTIGPSIEGTPGGEMD